MTDETDTFLVAFYTIVDDLYRAQAAPHKPLRPGQDPTLSDSEVITLAVLQQASGKSEGAFLAFVAQYWAAYFPHLIDRTAFNRRVRDLGGVMMHLVPCAAQIMGAQTAVYQALDSVPVPLMSRTRGDRHRTFGWEAGIGVGGPDKAWYYGCKLLLSVTDDGLITGFAVAPAATDDRWAAEAFLCWRQDRQGVPWRAQDLPPSHKKGGKRRGPTGRIWGRASVGAPSPVPYLADLGFASDVWGQHWLWDYQALVLTKDHYTSAQAPALKRELCGWRQVIETVNGQLVDVFHLHFPGARSLWGLLTRLAAKVLALNIGEQINRQFGRPTFALATLFTC
jgi:hypothetical protein